jgi:DivIVA domain-containing protein
MSGVRAETADAQFCVLCGASVIHQLSLAADPAAQVSLSCDASAGHWPARPAPDSDVGGTVLAEWVEARKFSTVRLRPGYDQEEVDAFLDEAELRLAAQGSDLDTGKAQDGEPELDADSLPVQDQPATSQTYLIATACLVGGLVSVGLAATQIAEYAHHNRVGNLAILASGIQLRAGDQPFFMGSAC